MPYFGELIALLTAFLWSGTSYAFTEASKRIGSLQLNINRMILAVIFLFAIIGVFGFSIELSFSQIEFLVISGIAGLVLGDSFLFKSFQLIGARLGMLLMALVPGFSALLALIFLAENLTAANLLGMLVTLTGISVVVMDRNEESQTVFHLNKLGVFYGVLGALGQASGLILAKFAFEENEVNGFVAAFIRLLSAVIILLPAIVLLKRYQNPVKLFRKDLVALKAMVTGTILGPVLGISSSLIAITYAKIGIATTLMSTMPVIMLPIARYYYKERLTGRAIMGAIIAVIGVAILFLL
ncbi:MAG: DMT family transporter [Ignavibacterium sp.]|nr:MAG: DMT family transporter [Ignavibacterium sp.]